MYRLQREEAKITAWENLQRAKAEAAIRKLEVSNFYSLALQYALYNDNGVYIACMCMNM